MDLGIDLDSGSRKPLYGQIYEYIRDEIRAGRIKAGERLPSTRLLARNLHVARTTAELAYAQLEDEGYIEKRQGSGAYACRIEGSAYYPGEEVLPAKQAGEETEKRTAGITEDAARAVTSSVKGNAVRAAASRGVIDFSPRRIDMSAFPYPTWRRIMRGILTGDRSDLFDRGDPQGDPELRGTIAHYLHLSRGCRCSADQIVIGAGNDYLLLLLSMIFDSGQRIGMESPGYSRAARILEAAHEEIVLIPSGPAGMDIKSVGAQHCSLVYTMPARQYPLGTVMSYPVRTQLLRWASGGGSAASANVDGDGNDSAIRRNLNAGNGEGIAGGKRAERYIIEDDYDSQFRYHGRPIPSLQSEDTEGHVIYLGTFSKSIAPAVRVSYMILPGRLMPLFRERAGVMACSVPRLDQAILNEFIRDGYYERYLNKMRKAYRTKHDLMLECLKPFEKEFDILGEGAGLHLVLAVKKGSHIVSDLMKVHGGGGAQEILSADRQKNSAMPPDTAQSNRVIEEHLAEDARRAGVLVHPMNHLYPDGALPEGQRTPPAFLLGFASLSEEDIREGLLRLQQAWGVVSG